MMIENNNLQSRNLQSRIVINPDVMMGKPIIRGMRITVEQIVKALAGGVSETELMEDYPELEKEDFQAVYAYAAEMVESEQVYPVALSK